MNPLILAALLSFGPAAFSKLFQRESPGFHQRQLGRDTTFLLSPQDFSGATDAATRNALARLGPNLGTLAAQFYQAALGSPAYAGAQRDIATGANLSMADLARALAQRGIGETGIGAVESSMGPSVVGGQMAGLRTQAYNAAQGQAWGSLQPRLTELGAQPPPSQSAQLFAGGLSAFEPFLRAYLGAKYPNLFNFSSGSTQGTPVDWQKLMAMLPQT